MGLSREEADAFSQIEASLSEDPQFQRNTKNSSRLGAGHSIVLGVITLSIGLIVLLGSLQFLEGWWVIGGGVIGFAILVFGGTFLYNSRFASSNPVVTNGVPNAGKTKQKSRYMQNLEDKWEQRRTENGMN